MMYFNLILGIASLFPIIVPTFSLDPESLLLSDNLFATDPSSSIDQLSDNSINPPLALTDNSLLSSNTLDGSNLFANSEIGNPSNDDLLWDDSKDPLLLAGGCSTPDMTLPPARGKSRLKQRGDGPAECLSPDISQDTFAASSKDPAAQVPPVMLPQVFDAEKHSSSCWQITLGMLPFAVAGEAANVVDDPSRTYGFRVTLANAPYTPRTVYQATVSKFFPPPTSLFSPKKNLIPSEFHLPSLI